MADNIKTLRDELTAASAVLEPQIRGLHDLLKVSITGTLIDQIRDQIEIRERRQNLIHNVLQDLAALEADGYPTMNNAILSSDLFRELQGEESDLDAAVAVFDENSPASKIAVSLGEAAKKPL